jgi:hypothetical protein
MPTALFAEWCPDQPDLGEHSKTIQNVRPRTSTSYGPMQSLIEYGSAINSACKGVGSFEGSDGTVVIFAGTATKLYLWNGSDWDDVTRGAGDYTLASEDRWVFEQFGDYVYADNGVDVPQVWQISISVLFAAASGSPPTSKYLATVRDFLFRANTTVDSREVQWSSQFDSNEWVVGTNQGDAQTFADAGRITGIVGGQYVVIFQIHKITIGTYVGPDLIFQFDEVSKERGCVLPGSIASIEQIIFFLDHDGFYRLDGGQVITPIGDGKVDEEFWANVDQDNFNAVWSAIDPRRKLYIIAWPTSSGNADTVWTYHWPSGRWAPSTYAIECMFFMFPSLNISLEDYSVLYPDLDAVGIPSLDSDQFLANPIKKLGAFTSNHKLAFFEGPALEATLDTAETQLGGGTRQIEVDRLIPLIDGGTSQGRLGYRQRQSDAVTYSAAVALDASGDQWFREPPARFHRARQVIPAASDWTHAQGVVFEMAEGGDR